MGTITGAKWQPFGYQQFAWACRVCSYCGSIKCIDCKCEKNEPGFEFDPNKYMRLCEEFSGGYHEGDKYWVFKGQRGGGKIFQLEKSLAKKDAQLKLLEEDREYWKNLSESMIQRVCELSQMYFDKK